MYIRTRDVVGSTVRSVDEDAGKVHDIFFDSHCWQVRYLVVDTGTWLPGRKVLLPFTYIENKDWHEGTIWMRLTRKMIEAGKEIRQDPPVSRQLSEAHTYVALQPVRQAEPLGNNAAIPTPEATYAPETDSSGRPLLRSAREVRGYKVQAEDGDIGHVEDFLIDDANWSIRYLEIDTRNWLPGRHVLVSPSMTSSVEWNEHAVHVIPTTAVIEGAPEYDRSKNLTTEDEKNIFAHYAQHGFLDSEAH